MSPDRWSSRQHRGHDPSPAILIIGMTDQLELDRVITRFRTGWSRVTGIRRSLELVVVTHVDADHIGGMLKLLEDNFHGVRVRDLWFNGFRHLAGPEAFGEKQGERLTGLILDRQVPWNAQTGNAPIDIEHLDRAVNLPGGAVITLLSPGKADLARLKKKWIAVCGAADLYADIPAAGFADVGDDEAFGTQLPNIDALASTPFKEDDTEANGSSIAFIVEYKGTRVLCGADAYPSSLLASLQRLYGAGPYEFDLVKVPHHGSEGNLSMEFIEALKCRRYLFSSNGARFKHPKPVAVARVIKFACNPELIFNYRSDYSAIWDNQFLQMGNPYSTRYGDDGYVELMLA